MSLSRQVLSSPFDIPAKPRASNNANTRGRRTKIRSRNRGTSLGRCVGNIMTDSRVVRRSSFNPPIRNLNNVQVDYDQSNRGQYIVFDSRLLEENESVFASPIVTVIEVDPRKNVMNENQRTAPVNKKQSKAPIAKKAQRNIHVQTDDHVSNDVPKEQVMYSDSGTQTYIHSLLDCDDDVEETHLAEKRTTSSIDTFQEAIPEQLLDQMNRNDRLTSWEIMENISEDEPPGEVPALDTSVNKENSQLDTILTGPNVCDISVERQI